MPSPFPGMDPYLETPTLWAGVHTTLIVAMQAELNRVLPEGYIAKINEYVWVQSRKKNRFVEIVTTTNRRVLTVLELLSPSNKRSGEDRDVYLTKRSAYFPSVNLVEIDLLRDGDRMPMGRPSPPLGDYYAFACLRDSYPNAQVWAFGVQQPLPNIPIPLDHATRSVTISLRACLDRVYDEGRYASELDYSVPPVPALRPSDAAWAVGLLRKPAKKKRR